MVEEELAWELDGELDEVLKDELDTVLDEEVKGVSEVVSDEDALERVLDDDELVAVVVMVCTLLVDEADWSTLIAATLALSPPPTNVIARPGTPVPLK